MGWMPFLYAVGVFLLALTLGMTIALGTARRRRPVSSSFDVLRLLRSGPSKADRRPSDTPPPGATPPP